MKKVIRFILLTTFIIVGVSGFAQKPQPVYSVVRQVQDFDWYEAQAKAWKQEIDKGTTNPMAWVYWNEANRMAAYFCDSEEKWKSKLGDYFVSNMETIVESAEKHIPNTFEYYYLKMRSQSFNEIDGNENDFEYFMFKAQEIRPYDDLLLSFLLNHYVLKNDKANIELVCKKWYESNEIPQEILTTLYNMLISLDKNAVLLVYGDNDTYPAWVLQNAKNIRPDVLIINVSFAYGIPEYRKTIFEEHKIKPLNEDRITMQQFFKHLVENLKNRSLYVSVFAGEDMYKEYSDKMYFTGLAFKYSPKPFDNLAVLRDNVENKFLLDFLKQNFHNPYAQSAVNQMSLGYMPAFLQLYNYYKKTKEADKAKKIKELATTVAQNAEVTKWLDEFEK